MKATNYIKPSPGGTQLYMTTQDPKDYYTGKPITLDGRLFDLVYTAMGISETAWIIKDSLYGEPTSAEADEINEKVEEPYLESIDDKIRFLEKELSHISQTLKEASEFIK